MAKSGRARLGRGHHGPEREYGLAAQGGGMRPATEGARLGHAASTRGPASTSSCRGPVAWAPMESESRAVEIAMPSIEFLSLTVYLPIVERTNLRI